MKVGLVSLGCSKNLVDSENLLGWFKANDHTIVSNLKEADTIVINTCGFIEPAKQEGIETILEMADYKKHNCKNLIVTGCLVQRYHQDLVDALPEVDAWVRIQDYPRINEILSDVLHTDFKVVYGKQERLQSTAKHTAYLKIAEGCSNRCTYCAIPLIRGDMNSYPIDDLLLEAIKLADNGVKECVLIAQDTSRYGLDKGMNQLPRLLDELNKIDGFHWLRLLYQYPDAITDEILDAMKRNDKVLPYFDIPIQHANNRLLKLMNRKGTIEDIRKVISRIKEVFPRAILRTTIIVGFPSETEEEFQELLNFIEEVKFDRLGAFIYSPEEDTVAFDMKDAIEKDVKEERYHRLMHLQSHISYQKMQEWLNEEIEVCVESRDPKSLLYHGRSVHSAPDDVDGEVLFTSNHLLKKGSFVSVRINRVEEYDLFGETVE
jgi:ribosomal protein S12 methylthiotransferase